MKEYAMTNDPILKAIVEELMSLYHCHTIILCGSRARGDFTASSDNDVAGIMKTGEKTHCTP